MDEINPISVVRVSIIRPCRALDGRDRQKNVVVSHSGRGGGFTERFSSATRIIIVFCLRQFNFERNSVRESFKSKSNRSFRTYIIERQSRTAAAAADGSNALIPRPPNSRRRPPLLGLHQTFARRRRKYELYTPVMINDVN